MGVKKLSAGGYVLERKFVELEWLRQHRKALAFLGNQKHICHRVMDESSLTVQRPWIDDAVTADIYVKTLNTEERTDFSASVFSSVLKDSTLRALHQLGSGHGGLHPSNIMVQTCGDDLRIIPVDWLANAAALGVGDLVSPPPVAKAVGKRQPHIPVRPKSGKKNESRVSIASAMAAFGGVELKTQASAARQLEAKGKWSVLLNGRARGPFPARKIAVYIKRGSIAADTRVAAPDWKDWKPLEEVVELQSLFLDQACSSKASWLWYECHRNTQLTLEEWDAISLMRTCAALRSEDGDVNPIGHEAIETCRRWYDGVSLSHEADEFAQNALAILGRYPAWAVPAEAPELSIDDSFDGRDTVAQAEDMTPIESAPEPIMEETVVHSVSPPDNSVAEVVAPPEEVTVEIPQERSEPPTSLPPPIASIPQFDPKAYVHGKLDEAMEQVGHSMLLETLQTHACASASTKGISEREFESYLGVWLTIRRVKSEADVTQSAINWIEKSRIANTRWVKSTGIGNATRVFVSAGLSEPDAASQIATILADTQRWGCALDDEKNANRIWQTQVSDFLNAKAKGKKYTQKHEREMMAFLNALDVADADKKLARYLRKLGYELKAGWF